MNMENNVSHSDLADLIPPVIEVSVAGEVIAVTPIKVRELMAFSQAIAPLLQALGGGAGQNWADLNISTLLMNHTDAVIRAVAIGIRREVEFINNLDIDELIKLGNAVVEVNVDFYPEGAAGDQAGVGRIVSMAEQHNHADGQSSI